MSTTPYLSNSATSEAQAWEALKALGDAALAQGGLQAVLQMFVGTLTGAEEVARVSEEAGHPDSLTPEVIAQWISTDSAPGMRQALRQDGAE
jgi:cytosine/adenosine deaminase-related metal-dependent hydrolase